MPDFARVWDSPSPAARVVRAALLPLAVAFRAGVGIRNALYDARVLPAHELTAPCVSVGNLTVGGTGKTPFASWLASELLARRAHPAVLLRGYGEDETLVHKRLVPGAIVIADQDRVRGATAAVARGADVLILDDGFQHRRIRRDADIVLVSADAAAGSTWPLPAGPWREPMAALRRSRLAVVTRKAAADHVVSETLARIAHASAAVAVAVVRFEPHHLVPWAGGPSVPLAAVPAGARLAVSAIGDPAAFEAQLAAAGLVVTSARYPDHHRFDAADVVALASRAAGVDRVVCTLKDAVKLGPLWPNEGPPLWYLSQRIVIERGAELITGLLADLLDARKAFGLSQAPRPTN